MYAKKYILPLFFSGSLLFGSLACNNQKEKTETSKEEVIELIGAEVACASCQFGQDLESCDLALRMKDKVYLIDGTTIDDHGDAHDSLGFCNAIRLADLTGNIHGNRVQVTSFKLHEVTH